MSITLYGWRQDCHIVCIVHRHGDRAIDGVNRDVAFVLGISP